MEATIFTTEMCAYCPMVAKWLTNKGIPFTKVGLDDKPALRQELLERTGAMTVPITKFDFTDAEIENGKKPSFVVGFNVGKLAEAIA